MNRTLKLSMLTALALGSSQALALQLGQVQVKSALGQPLLAEIPLRASSASEWKGLSVRLASSDAFARAGIVGGRTSLPLQFNVVSHDGQKFIRITTSSVVDNPYLDLLLEVDDHAGKSMREVAILLDPASSKPMAAPATPAPASVAAASPRPSPATRGVPRSGAAAGGGRPSRAVSPAVSEPATRKGQYGPVQKGQNLSSIARATALPGVDMAQMLLAYKQANPDAFYRDNINALKSGVVLRVPTVAQAQAATLAQAFAEVRRENSDWRAGVTGKPVTVADAGTASNTSSSPGNRHNGLADRLALVPARNERGAGSAGSAANQSSDKLRQELLRTQESVASLQQQGDDLKSRLKALSDINDNNAHLLSLKDSEIAQLQAQLAAARKAAHLPPQAAANTPVPAASQNNSPAAGRAPAVPGSSALAASAAVHPARAATAPNGTAAMRPALTSVPKRAVMKPRPAHHVYRPARAEAQPWYMQAWAWAAAGGVVLVLLLLALLGRRRKPADEASSRPLSIADRFDGPQGQSLPLVEGEDVDQDELLDQLAEHPEDVGLHLELVTLYYSRRDVEHFEAAAEAMHAHITDPQQDEWQDVLHMGEDLVPGHPLFDHHEERPIEDAPAAHSSFEIDEYAHSEDIPSVTEASTVSKPSDEYSFNFNLSPGNGALPGHGELEAASLDEAVSVQPPAATDEHFLIEPEQDVTDTGWNLDDVQHVPRETAELVAPGHHETVSEPEPEKYVHSLDDFSDDPVDTKLDLARAYLDMGDAEGAQAMLGEVMREGTQMQRDTAKALLEKID